MRNRPVKFIRLYGLFVIVLLCFVWAPAWAQSSRTAQGQRFFQTLNDVPLMPGLYEMLDESVVFDKPEGRIVESAAASEDLASQEIRAYYRQALPQLGWNPVAEGTFVRQGESLTLRVENQGDYNIVRFMVVPR